MVLIRRYAILLVVTVLFAAAFAPVLAHAQLTDRIVPAACGGKDAATACNLCALGQLAKNVLNFSIFLFIVVAAVVFTWAGFKYLTAGGNAQAAQIARKTLTYVAGGLILVLCAWLIVNAFMSVLLDKNFSQTMPWNQLCPS